jgi:hypothetical protein
MGAMGPSITLNRSGIIFFFFFQKKSRLDACYLERGNSMISDFQGVSVSVLPCYNTDRKQPTMYVKSQEVYKQPHPCAVIADNVAKRGRPRSSDDGREPSPPIA